MEVLCTIVKNTKGLYTVMYYSINEDDAYHNPELRRRHGEEACAVCHR